MPEDCGSVRFSMTAAAMAASTALPPALSISWPARVACGLAVAIMNFFAVTAFFSV
jgi:Na+/H+-translocating membrane pyrophosphatase